MKNGLQTAGFLLLFLFVFIFFSSSCESTMTRDRSEYTKNSFKVEICGKSDEIEIGATLCSLADAKNEEIRATLRYTSPSSLDGMTVTLSANGKYSVRLNGTTADTKGSEGLIEAFRPVFEMGEIYSVTKNSSGGEDVRVCDENCDLIYVFSKNEITPSHIRGQYKGKNIDLTLRNFSFDFGFQK